MGLLDKAKGAARNAEAVARKQIRDEARAAVLPWVLLAVGVSLYAMRRGRR